MRGWSIEVRVLDSWTARLKGLLGTDADACPVMLTRCGSVHTLGMRYPLDLLFIGKEGEVLMSCRDVAPVRSGRVPRRFALSSGQAPMTRGRDGASSFGSAP